MYCIYITYSGFVICFLLFLSPNTDAKQKTPSESQTKKLFPANQGPASAEDGQAPVVFFHHFGVLDLDHVPT